MNRIRPSFVATPSMAFSKPLSVIPPCWACGCRFTPCVNATSTSSISAMDFCGSKEISRVRPSSSISRFDNEMTKICKSNSPAMAWTMAQDNLSTRNIRSSILAHSVMSFHFLGNHAADNPSSKECPCQHTTVRLRESHWHLWVSCPWCLDLILHCPSFV